MSALRLGVMGGTFDPPHLGHLAAASQAHHQLNLDEVVFIPAGDPWQRARGPFASREDRLAMTRLAVADDDRFSVSAIEIERPGPSYTVDTLLQLRAERAQEVELFVLLGADALSAWPSWHRAAAIPELANLVGISRPGVDLDDPGVPDGKLIMVTVPGVAISSSECRERFALNAPNKYLVQDNVIAYVANHDLYRGVSA